MNISTQKIDELNALIKVKVGPEDYEQKVSSTLKEHQKKAQMPGFRPGKVPVGMIKKMYGKSIMVDEINKLLSDSLYKHINEEKLEVLGNPLPKHDEAANIDWDNQKEFEFSYEVGLAPQLNIDLSKKDKFTRNIVRIDDKLMEKYINDIRKNFGKPSNPEIAEESDVLMGDFVELDNNGEIVPGGIFKSSTLAVDRIKNTETKKKLTGLKKDDSVELSVSQIGETPSELSALLGITAEQAADLKSNFKFTLKNIARMQPADLNQELFDKVYGPGKINSEEEFKNKIKEELTSMFAVDSDRKLKNDIVEGLLKKVNVKLPEEFLKRWLMVVNEKPLTYEQVNAEFDQYGKSLKWQLLENKILKDNEIKVSNDEALEHTKKLITEQYARYGKMDVTDEELTATANKILSKEEEAKKIYEGLYDQKAMELFKAVFTIEDKEVSYEEFFNSAK
jgi:trigger factor